MVTGTDYSEAIGRPVSALMSGRETGQTCSSPLLCSQNRIVSQTSQYLCGHMLYLVAFATQEGILRLEEDGDNLFLLMTPLAEVRMDVQ